MSPERCSGVKNKSKEDCMVFATGSWKMVKEFSLSIIWWQDKQSIITLVLICTKSKVQIKTRVSSKIQAKISLASCCSKMWKSGLPDFTSTCFGILKNWEGSITNLDDFKRYIICTKEDTKGDSVFETALKLDQNFTMGLRYWRVAII